jgi:predicted TIM-barrel fold metal-dependent hydrolase
MIDAHVHVWSLDASRYPWHQTLAHVPIPTEAATAESLLGEMDRAGVSHAVLVQPSVYGWHNDYLCHCLERWPSRFVGVCLVDPQAKDAAECLSYWTLQRGCRGLRINLIAEPDPSWILSPERVDLWQTAHRLGVSIALQTLPAHAAIIGQLATTNPDITFIVDYLGPDAFHDGTGVAAIERLAPHANVHYKILCVGQDSHSRYPFEDLAPLYRAAARTFGPDRLLFGTDYPHLGKAYSYANGVRWLATLPFLDESARKRIGDENARKLWRFDA